MTTEKCITRTKRRQRTKKNWFNGMCYCLSMTTCARTYLKLHHGLAHTTQEPHHKHTKPCTGNTRAPTQHKLCADKTRSLLQTNFRTVINHETPCTDSSRASLQNKPRTGNTRASPWADYRIVTNCATPWTDHTRTSPQHKPLADNTRSSPTTDHRTAINCTTPCAENTRVLAHVMREI